jgi:predicted DNA-binding mobile mystery protein A
MKAKQKLIIEQLDRKMEACNTISAPPAKGWLDAVRVALKMSFRQFGKSMGITAQSAEEIVKREKNGSITLKNLREAARALDMKLVYGLVPNEGTIDKMLDKQAYKVAKKIVLRSSQSMKLEDQGVNKERLEKAVREMAEEIKREMPRYLWD